MDFSKAFDFECHQRILVTIRIFGACSVLLKWFENSSIGRKHKVIVYYNNGLSNIVSQGAILGPILFITYTVFTNHRPDIINNSKVATFADDSKCYRTVTKISDSVVLYRVIYSVDALTS